MVTFEEYGDGIGSAWTVLREHANRAGADAPVPTCPGWTVRDLVAHQGMVHRWATGVLRGERVDADAVLAEGVAAVDQLDWFDVGARALLQALVDAPEDLDAWFFLAVAETPRVGWARRQAHETSVHAVDAMAASLGRPPTAAETWLRPRFAADGVDELLRGFLPRRRSRLRAETERRVRVESTDTGDAWTLAIGPDVPVCETGAGDADVVLRAPAVDLYLGLWNRGDAIECDDPGFLELWRRDGSVVWS